MKLEAMGDKLVVKQTEVDRQVGGIIIPDTAGEKPIIGQVISVGHFVEENIHPGDFVIFNKYGGTKIEFEDDVYLVLPESDILAKVDG